MTSSITALWAVSDRMSSLVTKSMSTSGSSGSIGGMAGKSGRAGMVGTDGIVGDQSMNVVLHRLGDETIETSGNAGGGASLAVVELTASTASATCNI